MNWNDQVMERCGPERGRRGRGSAAHPPRTDRGSGRGPGGAAAPAAEAAATEALVATYGDRVYRLAIRITGNSSDAEEVVQDALWAASRKIDTFRGTAAFGSWVYRITANAAYQKRRGRGSSGTRRRGTSSPPPSTRPGNRLSRGSTGRRD